MLNIKQTLKASFLLFSLIFFSENIIAQKIQANVDQVLHIDDIDEMEVSADGQFYATADVDVVAFYDTETSKSISSIELSSDILDVYFTEKYGQAIVTSYSDGGLVYGIHIELYDFIKNELLTKETFMSQLEFDGGDFYAKGNLIALNFIIPDSDHDLDPSMNQKNNVILYNYETKEQKEIIIEQDNYYGYFDQSGLYHITSVGEDYRSGTEYITNFKTGDITSKSMVYNKPVRIDLDLNNKCLFVDGDSLTFKSYLTGFETTIHNDGYFGTNTNGETDIMDFAFSASGEKLALVGGAATSGWSTTPGYFNEVGYGFVALYNAKRGKRIWKTNREQGQTYFKTNDMGWLNEETFLTVDEKGNKIQYHVSEEYYQYIWPITKNYDNTAIISDDFSEIIYSLNNDPTYTFKPYQDIAIELYDSIASNYIAVNDLGHKFVIDKDSWRTELNKTLQGPIHSYGEIKLMGPNTKDISLGSTGKFACIASRNETNSIGYIPEFKVAEHILNSNNDIIGVFTEDGRTFYSQDLFKHTTIGQAFALFDDNGTTLLNLENNQIVRFLTDNLNFQSQISADENLLCMTSGTYDNNNCQFFDLKTFDYVKIKGETGKIIYNAFDPESTIAFSINENHDIIIWDESTRNVITKTADFNFGEDRSLLSTNSIDGSEITINYYDKIKNITFLPNGDEIVFNVGNNIYKYNYRANTGQRYEYNAVEDFSIDPSCRYLAVETTERPHFKKVFNFIDLNTDKTLVRWPIVDYPQNECKSNAALASFHKEKSLVLLHDRYASYVLYDYQKEEKLATLKFFPDGNWIVFTPDGLFDASQIGREAMYYVVQDEVILYDQIKEKFWITGLFDKLVNKPHLISKDLRNLPINLYPKCELSLENANGKIKANLIEREGGIGRVSLFINNKEIETDINQSRKKNLEVNLLDYKDYLYTSGFNEVAFVTYNREGWLASRKQRINVITSLDNSRGDNTRDQFQTTTKIKRDESSINPGLFGLFVGTSKYANPQINLQYADKDALAFVDAMQKVSEGMYDPNRINLKVLTSQAEEETNVSSKQNILNNLNQFASEAKPDDIIVLFFSGHGLSIDDDFYYLTSEAGNIDIEQDKEGRKTVTVSSKEINEALRDIKSNKQVMVLDACHSGQITKIFEGAGKATSTSQEKALEFLKDKMGLFILASSEANQKSFETTSLEQGILTFSLLMGLSGEAADEDVIQVIDLLSYASNQSEKIGKQILGRSQRPVLSALKGANSYPIGFTNSSINVELPTDKYYFNEPRVAQVPELNDPLGLEKILKNKLKQEGSLGSKSKFLYITHETDKELYTISATYTANEEANTLDVTWYLLKNEEVFKGPNEYSQKLSKKDKIMGKILSKAIKAIEE